MASCGVFRISWMSGALVLAATAAASFTSCAPSGFADPTIVQTVRILASSADKPYAAPGQDVTLQALAFDGRDANARPEPMTIYWLPFVCEDPENDAYYGCFGQIEKLAATHGGGVGAPAPGDAGTSGDAGASGDAGTSGDAAAPGDAGPKMGGYVGPGGVLQNLPTGPSITFKMPDDVISAHARSEGSPVPYGLAIVFNVACAGHLELVPIDPANQNPQSVPIGCFDKNHHALPPDDWVFGFTRVYAYDKLTNDNPVISYVDVGGKKLAVTPQRGASQTYTTPACASKTGCLTMPVCKSTKDSDCKIKIGPVVPESSWQVNPEATDVHGNPLHEEIWVDFFTTIGSLDDAARLLYDSTTGPVGAPSGPVGGRTNNPTNTDTALTSPRKAGTGTLWMIVRDNRGGASWVTVPFLVQ